MENRKLADEIQQYEAAMPRCLRDAKERIKLKATLRRLLGIIYELLVILKARRIKYAQVFCKGTREGSSEVEICIQCK